LTARLFRYRVNSTTEKGTELPPIELSYDDAVMYLEKALAERGEDYVYPTQVELDRNPMIDGDDDVTCFYFNHFTGQPSCIIGHVLHFLGVKHQELLASEGLGIHTIINDRRVLTADQRTITLLRRAQAHQDIRKTWGDSVKFALSGRGFEDE
jgi:hypothetical protein